MKTKMVFLDWKKYVKESGKVESIYHTPKGIELSGGDFHSGTTFDVEISMGEEEEKELREALKDGYMPCLYLVDVERMEKK